MSKLSDYAKFDHLDDESDEDYDDNEDMTLPIGLQQRQQIEPPLATSSSVTPVSPPSTVATMYKDETTGRYTFLYDGTQVYQWEQTMDDVTIYVKAPSHVTKGNQVSIQIQPTHLKLGLFGGTQWFLDEPTFGTVDVSESTWSLEEDDEENGSSSTSTTGNRTIIIYLTKALICEQYKNY